MSKRTLSDELQSVLLARSFDAPDAEDTIARTLAQTVDKAALVRATRRRWWPSGGLLTGAAVLILAVGAGAGFVKLAQDNGGSASSSGMKVPARDAAGSATAGYGVADPSRGSNQQQAPRAAQDGPFSTGASSAGIVPFNLDCPHSGSGSSGTFSFDKQVDVGGERDLVVAGQCLTASGLRSASSVYTSSNGQIRATIIQQSDGLSVQSISTGPSTVTIRALQLPTSSMPESLQEQVYRTTDGGQSYLLQSNIELAPACRPADLSAEVVTGDGSSAVLQVRNTSLNSCVISGYPGPRNTSLRGPNGGAAADLVPIVLLNPGETASASIDQPARSVPCPSAPPALFLPTGAELTSIAFHASVNCQPVLHAYVAGSTGRG